jgi:hypothetical protein
MRMTGADFRDVSPNVTLELIPGHASALTPSPERVQPCPADLGSVHAEPFQVPGVGPWTSREKLVSFAQVGGEGLTGERDLAPKGEQRSDQAPH